MEVEIDLSEQAVKPQEARSETPIEKRNRQKDELFDNFRAGSRREEIVSELEAVLISRGKDKTLKDHHFVGSIEGHIFEELALDYYYSKLSSNPENRVLAEFLQQILINKGPRQIDFYEGVGAAAFVDFFWLQDRKKVEKQMMEDPIISSLNLLPESSALKNPDALLVDVVDDETTGRKVARIVGLLDAKINGHYTDEQKQGAMKSLFRLVQSLKPFYTEVISSLDIAADMPDGIDIANSDKLTAKVIRPQASESTPYNVKKIGKGEGLVIPVTRQEIHEEFIKMVVEVMDRME